VTFYVALYYFFGLFFTQVKVLCRRNRFDQYTIDEAKVLGIVFTDDWRNAQPGDWIKTTDCKVIQVLDRIIGKTYQGKAQLKPRKVSDMVVTGYGKTPTHFGKILARKCGPRRDGQSPVFEVRGTDLQRDFLDRLMEYGEVAPDGMFSTNSIIQAYMAVYIQNNPKSALLRGRGILKQKWAKTIMSAKMKDKLTAAGLDDKWVVNQYKELGEDGETPAATRLNAVNRVSELLGHNAKKVKGEQRMVVMLSEGDKSLLAEHRKSLTDKELDALISSGEINGYLKGKSTEN
jgi:hypothetical protein|tara:strand:+ start:123 stop:989 length:867 start_codon:yes stop_codon:yes gene_type:complete